jgi:hypothetical protein
MLTQPRPGAASFDAPEHTDITITERPPAPPRARSERRRWRWRARGSPARVEQRRIDVTADPMYHLTRFR